jgi:stage III sporulation protein AD
MLLREAGFKGAKLIGIVTVLTVLGGVVKGIERIATGLGVENFGPEIERGVTYILKIVGVSYVFGVSSDVCREIGEGGIASAMLTAGRVEILLLSLPVFREILGIGIEMMR